MSRFAAVLRTVSERLDLPQAVKSRILLEMAGDLEDLYQHHLEEGFEEARAAELAEDAFAVSDEALKHLARVHESGSRFTDRLTRQVGSWWEKVLLIVWVLAVVLLVATVAAEERFFLVVSPFVWPLLGLALGVFAFSLWKLYELFLKKPPDVRRLRSGLGVLLFFAGTSLAVSVCGLVYNLRWYAYHSWKGAPESVFEMFTAWILATSAMMIIGLVTAILAALMWLLLANLVTRSEHREVDALLGG